MYEFSARDEADEGDQVRNRSAIRSEPVEVPRIDHRQKRACDEEYGGGAAGDADFGPGLRLGLGGGGFGHLVTSFFEGRWFFGRWKELEWII